MWQAESTATIKAWIVSLRGETGYKSYSNALAYGKLKSTGTGRGQSASDKKKLKAQVDQLQGQLNTVQAEHADAMKQAADNGHKMTQELLIQQERVKELENGDEHKRLLAIIDGQNKEIARLTAALESAGSSLVAHRNQIKELQELNSALVKLEVNLKGQIAKMMNDKARVSGKVSRAANQ